MGGNRQSPHWKGTGRDLAKIFSSVTLYFGINGAHTSSPLANVLPMDHIQSNAWPLESMATALSTEKSPCEKKILGISARHSRI